MRKSARRALAVTQAVTQAVTLAVALLSGAPGCGSNAPEVPGEPSASAGASDGGSGGGASGGTGGSGLPSAGAGGSSSGGSGACAFSAEAFPGASASHLGMCTPVTYDSNPPSGGDHYAVWAAFRNYDFPVPAGFLVHALEHGAVVFWYNCADGCADEVAQATAMINALPADPLCGGQSTLRRAILVPWPDLDARWAASSWGFTTKADCFDAAALSSFYAEHSGQGLEPLCNPGMDVMPGACP